MSLPTWGSTIRSAWLPGYYVATWGNDAAAGTWDHPWKTLDYAANNVHAGDTLYIRGGTYHELFLAESVGTAIAPILITGYPGETVIVDGSGMTYPNHGSGAALARLHGAYTTLRNITVQYSGEYGVWIDGAHCSGEYLDVYGCWKTGVHLAGDNCIADHITSYSNSMINENLSLGGGGGWGTGMSVGRYPSNCIVRHSISHDNWGEGISSYEAFGTIIEDCISYDNMQNFYISDTKSSLVQRCLAYYTPSCTKYDTIYHVNFMVADELGYPTALGPGSPREASSYNTLINSLAANGSMGYYTNTAVISHCTVANNTFADADAPDYANIKYNDGGDPTAYIFENNIGIQSDAKDVIMVDSSGAGMTFTHNCWSKAVNAKAQGAGDVVSNPLLAGTDTYANPLWYKLQSGSPARGAGLATGTVTDDYWTTARSDPPDIGAHEYT